MPPIFIVPRGHWTENAAANFSTDGDTTESLFKFWYVLFDNTWTAASELAASGENWTCCVDCFQLMAAANASGVLARKTTWLSNGTVVQQCAFRPSGKLE